MILRAALLATLVSCQAPAAKTGAERAPETAEQPAADPRSLFPNAAGIEERSPPLRLRDAKDALIVRSFRFEPAVQDTPLRNAYRCGVVIEGDGTPQPLVTIGEGWTETVSCDGLVEGDVANGPQGTSHLLLIYATRSPNEAGRTAIVLVRERHEPWTIDEQAVERVNASDRVPSLASVRAALLAK